ILDELAHDPAFEFYCLVDSEAGVECLAAAARERNLGRPLCLLVELGWPGARCGARDEEGAVAIARAVRKHEPYLSLRGVEGFEGSVSGATPDEQIANIGQFIDRMVTIAQRCAQESLFGEGSVLLS